MQTKKMNMLNYTKMILSRVSFDGRLFEKELRKSLKHLMREEIKELRAWCYVHYYRKYGDILDRCFQPV
jgi:hypothetical protein